ncbi:hypothetical protein Tco_1298085 [Tanacetum coccineum]
MQDGQAPSPMVEHEQALKDEEVSNDSQQWTLKQKVPSKWFHVDPAREGYAVDNNGKKYLMLSARGVIMATKSFQSFTRIKVLFLISCKFSGKSLYLLQSSSKENVKQEVQTKFAIH